MTDGQFHVNLSLMTPGQLRTAWRLPGHDPLAYLDIDHFIRLAHIAEDASADAVFVGDSPALRGEITDAPGTGLDPLVMLGHLAAVTGNLGVIATSSTTYNSPYNLARRFQALDHVTKGRAAVNIVTTHNPAAAANFGLGAEPDKETRYRRADEFLDVVTGLWDSWGPDWYLGDAASGRFADADEIHRIDHHGEFFSVAGPLPVPPGPQGRPVIVQAGGSEGGRNLAGRYADVVFTVAQTLETAVAFREDIRHRAVDAGRDGDAVKISLGVVVIVGDTEQDARDRARDLFATLPIEDLSARLVRGLGLDPGRVGPDDPVHATDLPAELPDAPGGSTGFGASTRDLVIRASAAGRPVTPRDLVERSAGGAGHRLVVGTPEQIADDLETWFRAGAADGFTVMFADTAVDFERFATRVIPVLQDRGLFHRGYPARTLRERLGLG
jgi:FMN-dependent oxidoreductase (nitrilotriacetate monooxygenase family)